MRIAILDKDQFANLLRYGDLLIPRFEFEQITEGLSEEDALRNILAAGNPIEYPSQYIIVRYNESNNDDRLLIESVEDLMATDADSRRLFTSQFRNDLIIQPEKYSSLFAEYLDTTFQKQDIIKGIKAFRKICGLDVIDDYSQIVDAVYRGKKNRITYHHHYLLPAEERTSPYSLMISYDRHAPYSAGWAGYYCDVIETYCYYKKPELGYSEAIAEKTTIYTVINNLGPEANSTAINDAIKDEPFTQGCNTFFTLPGGYLVPLLFFILRDRFRNTDSFAQQSGFIAKVKQKYPEAFDIASSFVGGFFGYDKFYEDYYSSLQLPFIRRSNHTDKQETTAQQPGQLVEDKPDYTHIQDGELFGIAIEGSDLFKQLYIVIAKSLNDGKEKTNLLKGLSKHKDAEGTLEQIKELLLSPKEDRDRIKKLFSLKSYPKTMKKVREYYQSYKRQ